MTLINYITLLVLSSDAGDAWVYEVADFGAKNDGITLNIGAIQKAIDTCTAEGGEMKSMVFQNIVVDNSEGDKDSAFFLTGLPGHYIEDITIEDVQFIVSGGGTVADAERTPFNEYTPKVPAGGWPEFKLVDVVGANVENIRANGERVPPWNQVERAMQGKLDYAS